MMALTMSRLALFFARIVAFSSLFSSLQISAFVIARSQQQQHHDVSCRMGVAEQQRTIVDRSTLTLLEHVNLNVPSHEYILPFYFDLLGCGMDPRKASNLKSDAPKKTLWANCGASQFHLPFGDVAQRIPGHIGLRFDSLEGLKSRLLADPDDSLAVKSYEIGKDPRSQREFVKLVDRYDNVFYCRVGEPVHTDKRQPIMGPEEAEEWGDDAAKYGRLESDCRGLDYVEFLCPKGSAEKIALFYESVLDATTTCVEVGPGENIAIIAFGNVDENGKADQSLLFQETTESLDSQPGEITVVVLEYKLHGSVNTCFKN
jgi:hypothetical protein